jgi:hypothetical protein
MTIRIDDVIIDDDATKAALSGASGNLRLGGDDVDGDVLLFPAEGDLNVNATATFHLDANGGNLWMGGNGKDGDLVIHPSDSNDIYNINKATFHFDANGGNLWMGGNGKDGDLLVFPADASDNHKVGKSTFHVDGNGGNVWLGGNGKDGDLVIFPSDASDNHNTSKSTFHFDGNGGNLWMGGNGKDGDLVIFPSNASDNHSVNKSTFHFDGNGGNLWMGGNGKDGDIVLFPSDATNNHDTSQSTIHLDANAGDITLRNADCAEEFTVADSVAAVPGSVMVLNEEGVLELSQSAYDKRAVGIISGAGDYKPGLILDKQPGLDNRSPIAMMGKVTCLATASAGPIKVGDLLTSSEVLGHAMKATDNHLAFGSVIGKALTALDEGCGTVNVLVALQ